MKKILLTIILFSLTGCGSGNLGVAIDDKVDIEKEILKIEQEQEKEKTGKYKYKPKYKKDDVEYQSNWYKTPKGEIGYEIIIKTASSTKSIGYGVQAEERTWEIFNTASSTEL